MFSTEGVRTQHVPELEKFENELKSLKQKAVDEEQIRSGEIMKINAEHEREITELEKKIPAAVENPTPPQALKKPDAAASGTQQETTNQEKKIEASAKTYARSQKPRRQLVTPPPKKNLATMSGRSIGRKGFMESSSSEDDDEELFKIFN